MTELALTNNIRIANLDDDAIWRVELEAPKGNIIDSVMTAELTKIFRAAKAEPKLKAIVLTGEGDNFSYGASVEEHQPEQVADMLSAFHGLFRSIADSGVPVIAAVRGSCLGGGLELVSFCHRVIAHPEAIFGQPEIQLGVIAPVASVILADRIGRGSADDLLLTGRMVNCKEAREIGLVDSVKQRPEAEAIGWAEKHLLRLSASSLRYATRAARLEFMDRFDALIVRLERMYLDELMKTPDANEGISAFIAKRKPVWAGENNA